MKSATKETAGAVKRSEVRLINQRTKFVSGILATIDAEIEYLKHPELRPKSHPSFPPHAKGDDDLGPQWLQYHLERWATRGGGYSRKRRFGPVLVDFGHLWDVARAQKFRCAILGRKFDDPYAGNEPVGKRQRIPFSPSVDRIDCSIGYVPGNVRIVCLIVNFALSNFGDGAFHEMCEAWARFRIVRERRQAPHPLAGLERRATEMDGLEQHLENDNVL